MKTLSRILAWLITIFVPFALTFVGLRLLLTPAFPQVEYRTPGFPADDYGFTLQDRLHWSTISIEYLVNSADISFLGNLTFPDGSPLFNERELSHMQDVKKVVQPVLWIGYTVWFVVVVCGLWAHFGGWWQEYLRGLRRGGWLTLGLVAAIPAVVMYNMFARWTAGYRALTADAAAEILRIVSRDLDRGAFTQRPARRVTAAE